MHWSRWITLAVFVSLVVPGTTLGRVSVEPPREKVEEPPQRLQTRLMNGAYDEIDAIADGYRSSRIHMAGGYSALTNFYAVLTGFDRGGCINKPVWAYCFDDKRQAMER